MNVSTGLTWFKWVALLWFFAALFTALFPLIVNDTIDKVPEAIAMFVGGVVLTGLPAFLIGWLVGKHKPQS